MGDAKVVGLQTWDSVSAANLRKSLDELTDEQLVGAVIALPAMGSVRYAGLDIYHAVGVLEWAKYLALTDEMKNG